MHEDLPSLVFFGTGPVSLASLTSLAQGFTIEAVITKPDRPSSSGHLNHPPVKIWALKHAVPVIQPADSDQLRELFKTNSFASQLGVVVDYGLLIPAPVIDYFRLGIVNSHFSLLPEWRGADPITAAILSGQKVTGVSLMLIVPKLDAGPLIAQETYSLPSSINVLALTEALISLSNKLLQSTLPAYLAGKIKPWPQDTSKPVTYSRKLTKADGQIDWHKSAARLEREVRAYLGWPGSYAGLFDKNVIITRAHVESPPTDVDALPPGETRITASGQLAVACGDGHHLVIDRLKPAGKNEMPSQDFLAGLRI
jgi:methionyl-tRNA formyltransferase